MSIINRNNRKKRLISVKRFLTVLLFSFIFTFSFAEEKKFTQKLQWKGDKNAFEYKVEIIPEKGGKSTFFTTTTDSIEFSMNSGSYKYRIYTYDFLGRESSVTEWKKFEIIKALTPQITTQEVTETAIDTSGNVNMPVDITNITTESKVELINSATKEVIAGELMVEAAGTVIKAAEAKFPPVQEGEWQVRVTNPSGLSSVSEKVKIQDTKKVAAVKIEEEKKSEERKIKAEKEEAARIAKAKKAEEERIAKEKAAEEKRIAEEKKAEERRIAEEKKKEEARLAEEKRKAAEEEKARKLAEEAARKAEEKRLAEEKKAEERRIAEEKKKAEEEEKARLLAEAEAKRAEEQRLAEEKLRQEEEARLAEEKRKEEEARLAEEKRKEEERLEQLKKEEAVRLAEAKKAEEEAAEEASEDEENLSDEDIAKKQEKWVKDVQSEQEKYKERLAESDNKTVDYSEWEKSIRMEESQKNENSEDEIDEEEAERIRREKFLKEIEESMGKVADKGRPEDEKRIRAAKRLERYQNRDLSIQVGGGLFLQSPLSQPVFHKYTNTALVPQAQLRFTELPIKSKGKRFKLGMELGFQLDNFYYQNDYMKFMMPGLECQLDIVSHIAFVPNKFYIGIKGGANVMGLLEMVQFKSADGQAVNKSVKSKLLLYPGAQAGLSLVLIPARHLIFEGGADYTLHFMPDGTPHTISPYLLMGVRL